MQEKMNFKDEPGLDKFQSTAEMFRNFINRNLVWKDMVAVVEGWKQQCLIALSDPNEVNTLEALSDMQGRIYMCNLFLDLPQMAINQIEIDEKQNKVEEE